MFAVSQPFWVLFFWGCQECKWMKSWNFDERDIFGAFLLLFFLITLKSFSLDICSVCERFGWPHHYIGQCLIFSPKLFLLIWARQMWSSEVSLKRSSKMLLRCVDPMEKGPPFKIYSRIKFCPEIPIELTTKTTKTRKWMPDLIYGSIMTKIVLWAYIVAQLIKKVLGFAFDSTFFLSVKWIVRWSGAESICSN